MAQKAKRKGESATAHSLTVAELKARLQHASPEEYAALEHVFSSDTRKGVKAAFSQAKKRIEAQQAESERSNRMYDVQIELSDGRMPQLCVGLDEVGRGPLAGPLAVGAVVLPEEPRIVGLNDSKQLTADRREELADEIKRVALAWNIQYIDAAEIDAVGINASLKLACMRAISCIDSALSDIEVVLLDGNPLHCDTRERNVIKGDGRCASIAAASIIAKVDRDAYMVRMSQQYPEYGFASCKGYGSAAHIAAIEKYGLCPLHRASFCTAFLQESLF